MMVSACAPTRRSATARRVHANGAGQSFIPILLAMKRWGEEKSWDCEASENGHSISTALRMSRCLSCQAHLVFLVRWMNSIVLIRKGVASRPIRRVQLPCSSAASFGDAVALLAID